MTNDEQSSTSTDEPFGDEFAFWELPIKLPQTFLAGEDAVVYDLEERTSRFGEAIILFAKKIPWSPVNNRLVDQIVGSGTSVGANYCEADDGVSRADFKHRISICRKEARETKFFLRMISTAEPSLKSEARTLLERSPFPPPHLQPNIAQHDTLTDPV